MTDLIVYIVTNNDTVLGLKLSLNHNTQTTTLGASMKADQNLLNSSTAK